MSRTVRNVLSVLERLAPGAKAAGWDPVGLQVGDLDAPAESVGVAHEVTETLTERLEADPVDVLVTYHPLLFRPTARFVAGRDAAGRAYRLARAGVAVVSAHTNFDVAPGGSADALAEAFDLSGVLGFGPLWGSGSVKIITYAPEDAVDGVADAMSAAGAGRIGRYAACSFRTGGEGTFIAPDDAAPHVGSAGAANREPEVRIEMNAPAGSVDAVVAALVAAHPYEEPAYDVVERRGDAGFVGRAGDIEATPLRELVVRVQTRLGGAVRWVGEPDLEVQRVAVVPGSGGDFIAAARTAGADVLVTGDVRHHAARRAWERGLAIIDPGHIPTERPGLERLYAALAAELGPVRDLRDDDPDPWRAA